MKSTLILLLGTFVYISACSQKDTSMVIYFESNSYQISEIDKVKLIETVTLLTENYSIVKSDIIGFCDDLDTHDYNLALSKKRANTVAEVLSPILKLPDSNILINGKGEISLTHHKNFSLANQRANNRKTEITFHLSPELPQYIKTVSISTPDPETEIKTLIDAATEETPSYLEGDLRVGDQILLEGILFEGGQDIILEESIQCVQSLLNELKENPQISVQIQGHIYDPNNYDPGFYILDTNNLSERRARKIYQFLKQNGIANKRLSYIGLEGQFPLGGDPKFDRRVEIEITKLD